MASEQKPRKLQTLPELPNHYRYLKGFRVKQCELFLQRKCPQSNTFLCFDWHFPNQRRRRPIRKRDGTFNYSADTYCTKYDKLTGVCPDGDRCIYLHHSTGDTERRYHLRNFKTSDCTFDTDAKGFCTKIGIHCSFAHGENDKREPVLDIREFQVQDEQFPSPQQLTKQTDTLRDFPEWQDATYVLNKYKTMPCKLPLIVCPKGFACPFYHHARDRRRSPEDFQYLQGSCPNVKYGNEWGDPNECEEGDACTYCHTRTEQQYHPLVYKSSKCEDLFANQKCNRGFFCAFAHACIETPKNKKFLSGTAHTDVLLNKLADNGKTSPNLFKMNDSNLDDSNVTVVNRSNNNSNLFHGDNIIEHTLPLIHTSRSSAVPITGILKPAPGRLLEISNNKSSSSSLIGGYGSPFGKSSFGGMSKTKEDDKTNLTLTDVNRTLAIIGENINTGWSTPVATGNQSKIFSEETNAIGRKHRELLQNDAPSLNSNSAIGGGRNKPKSNRVSPFDSFDILTYKSDPSSPYKLFSPDSSSLKDDELRLSRHGSSSMENDKSIELGINRGIDENSVVVGSGLTPIAIPHASELQRRETFLNESFPISNNLNNPVGRENKVSAVTVPLSGIQDGKGIPNGGSELSGNSSKPLTTSVNSTGWGDLCGAVGSSRTSRNLNHGMGDSGSESGVGDRALLNILRRYDLMFVPVETLTLLSKAVSKALSSYNKDSVHYSCLNCKNKTEFITFAKYKPRTIILEPCYHQVLCRDCVKNVRSCPICGSDIFSWKEAALPLDSQED